MGASQVSNGSSLAGWPSPSQVRPADVHDFTVQLVAASEHGRTKVCRVPLNAKHDGFVPGWILRRLDVTCAIVMHDEPIETVAD